MISGSVSPLPVRAAEQDAVAVGRTADEVDVVVVIETSAAGGQHAIQDIRRQGFCCYHKRIERN